MNHYRRAYGGNREKPERVVVLLPREELEEIDGWGIPAGMKSRSMALRQLIQKGLKFVETEGNANESTTPEK